LITCRFEDGGEAQLRHTCADVVAIRDDKVLLVRRADHLVEGGKWATPGGYMDRDETIEQCAARELTEETGHVGSNFRLLYIDSRPERPSGGRQNVTIVFVADVGPQIGTPDHESTDMQWFTFGEVEKLAEQGEVAFWHDQYVTAYVRARRESLPLPLLDGVFLSVL
jgi:ADP-ribose pyrophosphatase YjhB (NUDIX family)